MSSYSAFRSGGAPLGSSVLLYDYTVVGADKASIDTGADTPDAGIAGVAAFPLTYRVLEIFTYLRADPAATIENCFVTLNNDTTSIYDRELVQGSNGSVNGNAAVAGAGWLLQCAAASNAAGVFGQGEIVIHNYAGTVGNKFATAEYQVQDTATANSRRVAAGYGYRSATAITRFKIAPSTGGAKFKIGSRISIFAR